MDKDVDEVKVLVLNQEADLFVLSKIVAAKYEVMKMLVVIGNQTHLTILEHLLLSKFLTSRIKMFQEKRAIGRSIPRAWIYAQQRNQ